MKLSSHSNAGAAILNGHLVHENGDAPPAKTHIAAPPRVRAGAEPFDAILWRLQARRSVDSPSAATLGVIGCEQRTGATTVAANLAVRASELSLGPVLLVETHRSSNSLAREWRLGRGPGLAELFRGEASMAEALRPGPVDDLHVIPAGALRRGEIASWEPGGIDALLAEATADYVMTIFDLPPAPRMRQALLLARRLDQIVLVVRAESTRKQDVAKVTQRMAEDGVALSGVVLNRQRQYVPRWLNRWM